METDRLYNNLLSSQPLAFNFFGFFRANPDVALAFLKTIRPDIIGVDDIVFEYAPESSGDSSAFDFGFVVNTQHRKGLLGLSASLQTSSVIKEPIPKYSMVMTADKNYIKYHQLYLDNHDRFPDDYYSYVRDKNFNQLFRNELLGMLIKAEPDLISC